ncbi:MAG: DUF2877 domain-containing protein [Nitriliruptorales bacterium]|nr:DUF2877 domain-containing protein [Nitriliruptorales bacterium]
MSATSTVRSRLVGRAAAGIETAITGPARPARVLGCFPTAVYLELPDPGGVIAVVARDGIALPNAVLLASLGAAARFSEWSGPWLVGDGRVVSGDRSVEVDSWYDARPVLAPAGAGELVRGLSELESALAEEGRSGASGVDVTALRAAIDSRDVPAVVAAAAALVGLGAGLTPSGDDVLAGAVSAGLAVCRHLEDRAGEAVFAAVGVAVAELAVGRTTSLSAALLRHAADGEMAGPARRLVAAVSRRGAIRPALDALLQVGHASGGDLAQGIVIGVASALRADEREHR